MERAENLVPNTKAENILCAKDTLKINRFLLFALVEHFQILKDMLYQIKYRTLTLKMSRST